jgi:copper transport protein
MPVMHWIPGYGPLGGPHLLASAAVSSVPFGSPVLWLTALERGVMLIGLAVALGGLAGRGTVRHYKGEFPAPLPEPWVLKGSLVGVGASAALVVTALADPATAASLARPAVAGPRAHATLVFAAIELVCFALAAAVQRTKRASWSLQFLLIVVLAESIRSHPEGLIPLAGALLVLCHLLPALLWVGMLVYVLQAAIAWRSDPAAMRGMIKLYADAAAWLFAIVIVTGLIQALLLVPIHDVLTTSYGRFLIVKAALVAVAAGLAVAGRRSLRRDRQAGAGPARVTRFEAAALVTILLITGLLTVITPPRKPIFGAGGGQAPAVHAAHPAHAAHPRTQRPA